MKSKKTLKYLNKLLDHMEYYNKMAPFPVFDTDYVNDVKQEIMNIKENTKKDYDEEPVVACRYCKSLHIVNDDVDNSICMRCNTVNELREFKNIYEYNDFVNGKK